MPTIHILSLFLLLGMNFSTMAAAMEPLRWDPTDQTNIAYTGDVTTLFTFKVTNLSSNLVVINDLKTSCGCTVAQLPSKPWPLKPGQTDHFDALVDIRGKTGRLFKNITVVSDAAPKVLTLTVDIRPGTNSVSPAMANRIWGQKLSAIDHQAVFTKECVQCHLEPAFGKFGAQLYTVACGICHEAKHRADMVPDLHSLKSEITPDYWRNWVTYGKAGSLMPGFTASLRGPLNDAQIKSLVAFLKTNFPRPVSITAVNFNHPDHGPN